MRSSFANVSLAFWSNRSNITSGSLLASHNILQNEVLPSGSSSQLNDMDSLKSDRDRHHSVFYNSFTNGLFASSNLDDSSGSSRITFDEVEDESLSSSENLTSVNTIGTIFAQETSGHRFSSLAHQLVANLSLNETSPLNCWSSSSSSSSSSDHPSLLGVVNNCLVHFNASGLNITETETSEKDMEKPEKVYWALFLILLPFLAVFGNILVILSVYKERSLQNVTNYFIVNLAFADLLVAGVVMPFAVYYLINIDWELSQTLCDFWIAVDVLCSTASILNLVAISVDRFIAVTKPIQYAKHRSNKRVAITIATVWIVSATIASPIVFGLNNTPERKPTICIFYNSDFIIYSSLGSFYIPCLLMIYLYYRIFKVIHARTRRSVDSKRSNLYTHNESTRNAVVIENKGHETVLKDFCHGSEMRGVSIPQRQTTNSTENRHEAETKLTTIKEADSRLDSKQLAEETALEMGSCRVIENHDVIEFRGSEEEEEIIGPNGNQLSTSKPELRKKSDNDQHNSSSKSESSKGKEEAQVVNQALSILDSTKVDEIQNEKISYHHNNHQHKSRVEDNPQSEKPASTESSSSKSNVSSSVHKPRDSVPRLGSLVGGVPSEDQRNSISCDSRKKSRFKWVRKQKSSRKKKEKASAKRERKATKTLAIVLGVFLFCWVPFFTCNIMDAICIKLESDDCKLGMTAFLFTTWLGYINSCANPVIYTLFNPEFRKAFKKILTKST